MNFFKYIYGSSILPKLLVLILSIACTSCNKLVDIDSPEGKVVGADAFNSDSTANSTVMGIYAKVMNGFTPTFLSGGITINSSLSSDDVTYTGSDNVITEFQTNSLQRTNVTVGTEWSSAYGTIYQTNACIEGISASNSLTPAMKSQLLGESKLMRGLVYLYLVNLFGDVPLVLTTNYQENARMGRTSSSAVYGQIEKDFKEAKDLLSAAYYKTGRIRPNKWAAAALLARVYLYEKKYAEAEAEATEVIGSNTYQLITDLSKVFGSASGETLWQLNPVLNNTKEGSAFIPSSPTSVPNYALRDELLTTFDAGDKRKEEWTKSVTVAGKPYAYPYKYRAKSSDGKSESQIVVRFAELFLIRAEAKAQQNRPDDAISDLNQLRQRARNTAVADAVPALENGLTKDEALTAVEKERRLELFAEFGHRWFDLKRTGRANAVLVPLKGSSWSATDQLYPIPDNEINLNGNLSQNDGYKN